MCVIGIVDLWRGNSTLRSEIHLFVEVFFSFPRSCFNEFFYAVADANPFFFDGCGAYLELLMGFAVFPVGGLFGR